MEPRTQSGTKPCRLSFTEIGVGCREFTVTAGSMSLSPSAHQATLHLLAASKAQGQTPPRPIVDNYRCRSLRIDLQKRRGRNAARRLDILSCFLYHIPNPSPVAAMTCYHLRLTFIRLIATDVRGCHTAGPFPELHRSMADIVLINPRFEVSYWGMEYALPFIGKRGNLPVACLPLLAALTPEEHTVTLIDENVEPIDWERCRRADIVGVTGMSVQRFRMKEILTELKRRGCFCVVGGPWVTVQEDYFGDLADVIFVGEAEETWPRFLKEWRQGLHQLRYEQVEKTDMTQGAHAAVRPAQDEALRLRQLAVFARLPVSVRVLRHHRHLRPPPAHQDQRPGDRRARGDPQVGHGHRLHRR